MRRFEQFYEHTAKAANDHRPEKRIALDTQDHLDALWSHALHHNAGNVGGGELSPHAVSDAEECIPNFRGTSEIQCHSADIALMGNLSRLDLESDWKTHAFGGDGSFLGVACQKGWDTPECRKNPASEMLLPPAKFRAGILPAMKPMLLLSDRSAARTCGTDDSRRDCGSALMAHSAPSIKGTPAVRSGSRMSGSTGTADDRTENRNWLIGGGSNIRNGQGKPIAALEFLRSRVVGLQIDSDDVYIRVVDKRLE